MNSIIKSVGFNSSYSDHRVYELWEPSFATTTTTTTENDTPTDNLGDDEQRQQQQQQENIYISTDFLTTFMNQLTIWDALDEENPKLTFNVSLILLILLILTRVDFFFVIDKICVYRLAQA